MILQTCTKVAALLILLQHCFVKISVNGQDLENRKPFDFRDVVKENKKYLPDTDLCPHKKFRENPVIEGHIPYMVALRREGNERKSWRTFCAGAIVTHNYVITAAHCLDTKNQRSILGIRVVAGTIRSEVHLFGNQAVRRALLKELEAVESWRKIAVYYQHEFYSKMPLRNDIAVLELAEPLTFSDIVKPIRMISLSTVLKEDYPCLISGFGLSDKNQEQHPPVLKSLCVPIIPFTRCQNVYGKLLDTKDFQFCAGVFGKDNCQADPGSPIVCKGYLAGVMSFIAKCDISPIVFTRLSFYSAGAQVPFVRSHSVCVKVNLFETMSVIVATYYALISVLL